MRTRLTSFILSFVWLVAALSPAGASADARYGAQGDPKETLPSLSGDETSEDIEEIRAGYNTDTGEVFVTARFYGPLPTSSERWLSIGLTESVPRYRGGDCGYDS